MWQEIKAGGQERGRWRRSLLGRFVRNRKGSTAIEFTILAIPFSMLVFAVLESCISFAAQQVMANAADDMARQFRTGQIKADQLSKQEVRDIFCERIQIVVSPGCPGLEMDLRTYTTFAEAAQQRVAFLNGDIDTQGFDIAPGPSMSKNMLRVFYRWPVITDFMRKSMANLPDGKTLHYASVTWQNEPFEDD
ncbi:pilus assembly protein [Chelativorans sp. ZYF759]|uniref:TadE/TadG family type IV pilus assembly protein n=1 Tax=Chelativorans sp. ZYF759 TaxID=2692213 RepID=UPI00145F9CC9|nr:TadE/TadG family type IV pilus assembly protein [Chelativorans sp. ZYF759]NMG40523.1 pilus assembly protein [Chelativorans sp. ZYF759]